jgi:hypothetical protein
MTQSEMYRKATRILETAESDDAIIHASQALKELNEGDEDKAMDDLNYAAWMEA